MPLVASDEVPPGFLGGGRLVSSTGEAPGPLDRPGRNAGDVHREVALLDRLRSSLGSDEFHLSFQPVFACASGFPEMVEALLRWRDPILGCVPPSLFIPVAEASGLIHALGRQVIDMAGAALQACLEHSGSAPRVAVNVSAIQIQGDEGLLDHLDGMFKRRGLAPSQFEIEVTESRPVENALVARRFGQALRARGIAFTMDDFGTGYAGLSNLLCLPIDRIKIDQLFVRHMGDDGAHIAMVDPMVTLAHNMGLTVVAEGVETAGQAAALRALGCDYLQGFFMHRPIPCEEFPDWWATHISSRK